MLDIIKKIFGSNSNPLSEQIKKDSFLVDVRTQSEFESGSVPGSVNIPLNQIRNELNKFKNKSNIIVFCASGMRSSQAKSILKQSGFDNVINGGTWRSVNKAVQQL